MRVSACTSIWKLWACSLSTPRQRTMEDINSTLNPRLEGADPSEHRNWRCCVRLDGCNATLSFRELCPAAVYCLQVISGHITMDSTVPFAAKSVTGANALLRAITSDGFTIALTVTSFSLASQSAWVSCCKSRRWISSPRTKILPALRISYRKSGWTAMSNSRKISVAASELTSISGQEVPSLASHQTLWNNTPPATLEVYRWRAAFVPFVGCLTIELNSKFGTMARAAVQGFLILPVSLKSMTCQQEQLVTNVCFVDLPDAWGSSMHLKPNNYFIEGC